MTQKLVDSTIEEIHQTRCAISDRFGGNVAAIAADAARRLALSNRPVWQPNRGEVLSAMEPAAGLDPNGESGN